MLAELDVLGAFVPALALWLFVSILLFVPLDLLLNKCGFYRLFWHPPLARTSLFACIFCVGGLAQGMS